MFFLSFQVTSDLSQMTDVFMAANDWLEMRNCTETAARKKRAIYKYGKLSWERLKLTSSLFFHLQSTQNFESFSVLLMNAFFIFFQLLISQRKLEIIIPSILLFCVAHFMMSWLTTVEVGSLSLVNMWNSIKINASKRFTEIDR